MEHVLKIRPSEKVCVDQDRLGALYAELGEIGAEDVVCRAMEEIALRLSHCSRLYTEGEFETLRKCAKSLIAMSEQIGMLKLAGAATNLIGAIDASDAPATAATLARLLRLGDQSLTAIWDLQDITI